MSPLRSWSDSQLRGIGILLIAVGSGILAITLLAIVLTGGSWMALVWVMPIVVVFDAVGALFLAKRWFRESTRSGRRL